MVAGPGALPARCLPHPREPKVPKAGLCPCSTLAPPRCVCTRQGEGKRRAGGGNACVGGTQRAVTPRPARSQVGTPRAKPSTPAGRGRALLAPHTSPNPFGGGSGAAVGTGGGQLCAWQRPAARCILAFSRCQGTAWHKDGPGTGTGPGPGVSFTPVALLCPPGSWRIRDSLWIPVRPVTERRQPGSGPDPVPS